MTDQLHKPKPGSIARLVPPGRTRRSPAITFSDRHAETISEFRATRKTLEAFNALARRPAYGRMMSELRNAVVRLLSNGHDDEARSSITEAVKALDVPRIDLMALARVPADAVANGAWRPCSVNVDLVDPDPTTRNGPETRFQKKLNEFSEKVMPGVKSLTVPGMYSAYKIAGQVAPVVDAMGRIIADPLEAAGWVARGWSDALATDVQKKLRDIRVATQPAGLAVGELAKLNELEQRAFLFAASKLSGMALDADQFIDWARDPRADGVSKNLLGRLKKWASGGLDRLAGFLSGTASVIHRSTSEESWRVSTVHLQFGGGVERFTVSTRAGFTIMFPTLEQVEREGAATVRVVSRFNPVETVFGGASLTSRGGGLKFRAGPIGAKISEFEHEVKAGIPGIIGVSVGEDYAYGPSVAFGYSPPIGIIGQIPIPLNVRAGGEVTLFHPALRPLAQATRKAAEKISIACDEAAGWLSRLSGEHVPELEDGWPLRQRWNIARRVTERAEVATTTARKRLDQLRAIGPLALVKPERIKKLLGEDAARPVETFRTIARYLEMLPKLIERETIAMRNLAAEACASARYDKSAVSRLTASLGRHAIAFEYVDVLLSRMLSIVEEEQELGHAAEIDRPLAANG